MRHRKSGQSLSRTSSHRRAMFRNLAVAVIRHELVRTSLVKAKELRRFLEPLVTLAKVDTVAHRRLAFARLRDQAAVVKLFTDCAVRHKDRPGGYLRILKCGFRTGDAALMALVKWSDHQTVFSSHAQS